MGFFGTIKKDSTPPEDWLKMGDECYQNKDFKTAVKYFRKAGKSDPSRVLEAKIGEARSLEQMGRMSEAVPIYCEILKINPDLNEIALIVAEYSVRRYCSLDDAIALCDGVIARDPSNSLAFFFKGLAYKEKMIRADYGPQKDTFSHESVHALDEAIRLSPSNFEAHYQKGEVLMYNKEYELAIQAYQNSRQESVILSRSFLYEAWCHHRLGHYDEAIRCYNRAAEVEPEIKNTDHFKKGIKRARERKEFDIWRVPMTEGREILLVPVDKE